MHIQQWEEVLAIFADNTPQYKVMKLDEIVKGVNIQLTLEQHRTAYVHLHADFFPINVLESF